MLCRRNCPAAWRMKYPKGGARIDFSARRMRCCWSAGARRCAPECAVISPGSTPTPGGAGSRIVGWRFRCGASIGFETAGELGAMLREAQWLKGRQPVYNRRIKGDANPYTLRLGPQPHAAVRAPRAQAPAPSPTARAHAAKRLPQKRLPGDRLPAIRPASKRLPSEWLPIEAVAIDAVGPSGTLGVFRSISLREGRPQGAGRYCAGTPAVPQGAGAGGRRRQPVRWCMRRLPDRPVQGGLRGQGAADAA